MSLQESISSRVHINKIYVILLYFLFLLYFLCETAFLVCRPRIKYFFILTEREFFIFDSFDRVSPFFSLAGKRKRYSGGWQEYVHGIVEGAGIYPRYSGGWREYVHGTVAIFLAVYFFWRHSGIFPPQVPSSADVDLPLPEISCSFQSVSSTISIKNKQSWALWVFFNFFNNKK